MIRFRTLSAAVFLTIAGANFPSFAQQSDAIVLSPLDLQNTAFAALETGNAARALALSEALLLRNPEDLVALRVGAQAALAIGQSSVAVAHGRTLYRVAETDELRFFAARVVALAQSQQENYTRAQIWLRRARQVAPTTAAAQSIAQDYVAVRSRNPLRFSLDFGFLPSSNINNGSSEETFELFGIPFVLSPSAQSLSGYQFSAQGSLSYTLRENQDSRTAVSVSGQLLRYGLSSGARDDAPDFDVSVLDYERVVLGLRHDWRAGGQPLTATLEYGVTRSGGDTFARDVEVGLSTTWILSERALLQTGLRLGRIDYEDTDVHSNSMGVDLAWSMAFANARSLTVRTTFEETDSDVTSPNNLSRQSIDISYNFGRVTDAMDINVGIGREWRSFDPSTITPSGRDDIRTDISLDVGLPLIELYGFSPVAKVSAYQTDSNSSRFQSDGVSLGFSVRSSF